MNSSARPALFTTVDCASPLTTRPDSTYKSGNVVQTSGATSVTTAKRSRVAEDIPTLAQAGVPGYDANAWFGVFAPAGTPDAVIARLQSEISKIVKIPEIRDRFLALGAEPVGSTPEQFAAFYRAEVLKWAKVVKDSGAQID